MQFPPSLPHFSLAIPLWGTAGVSRFREKGKGEEDSDLSDGLPDCRRTESRNLYPLRKTATETDNQELDARSANFFPVSRSDRQTRDAALN